MLEFLGRLDILHLAAKGFDYLHGTTESAELLKVEYARIVKIYKVRS